MTRRSGGSWGAADGGGGVEPVYTPIHSPNLDSLAKESAIFEQAYIQWPYCGPSRAAILIGRWVINILLWCSLVFTSYGENYNSTYRS